MKTRQTATTRGGPRAEKAGKKVEINWAQGQKEDMKVILNLSRAGEKKKPEKETTPQTRKKKMGGKTQLRSKGAEGGATGWPKNGARKKKQHSLKGKRRTAQVTLE